MKEELVSRRRNDTVPANTTFQDFLEEAELCCEHARLAARRKRYEASRGLFITAVALYQRAVKAAGTSYPSIENRVREIELEMAAYAELARSMARPLLRPAPIALRPAPVARDGNMCDGNMRDDSTGANGGTTQPIEKRMDGQPALRIVR